jgi:hypothetical protein
MPDDAYRALTRLRVVALHGNTDHQRIPESVRIATCAVAGRS